MLRLEPTQSGLSIPAFNHCTLLSSATFPYEPWLWQAYWSKQAAKEPLSSVKTWQIPWTQSKHILWLYLFFFFKCNLPQNSWQMKAYWETRETSGNGNEPPGSCICSKVVSLECLATYRLIVITIQLLRLWHFAMVFIIKLSACGGVPVP